MNPFAYIISTDSTCDLPAEWLTDHQIEIMPIGYTVDAQDYWSYTSQCLDDKEFYDKMRAGAVPVTTQTNPEQAEIMFRRLMERGQDVLHLAFSSGLSGTCNNAKMAAETVMKEFPGRKIVVIDTLSASLGEGLMVYHACQYRQEGKSLEETAQKIQDTIKNYCHIVTPDDLKYLYRGGRLSKTAAVMGTMLGVKPIIHMDDTGHLVAIDKVRGRKQALNNLVDKMAERVGSWENPVVFISHSDCQEDAEYVQELVRSRFGTERFVIHMIGPTIGSHTGPGTVALFFMGDKR